MPDAARQVIADGPAGARRVAAALAAYWEAVIAPDWEHMSAVIEPGSPTGPASFSSAGSPRC